MSWIVVILGLAGPVPTFRGPYDHVACERTAKHVNIVYGKMVHARCITDEEAKKLGWRPK